MKVNFSSLFKTPVQKYKFFFIYGNDLGVFDRIILFLKRKIPSSIEIKSEKDLLIGPQSSFSLFEETHHKPLTLVLNVSDKILGHIDQLGDGLFIFTSEKARAQSKLVTYFSKSPLSLAIGAYASPITSAEFDFLIGDIKLSPPFKSLLFKTYQNDYRGLLAALEKIKLYGDIPESAYPLFLESFSSSDDLQPLIHSFLLRNLKTASEALLNLNSADSIPLLRSLLRTFQNLHELMPYKKAPHAISWQSLKSQVFFKDQPVFQGALSRWNNEEVRHFLESLLTLECKVKFEKITTFQINQELMNNLRG